MSMKTKLETLATIIAYAVCADGRYDEAEKEALAEIAEAFDFDEKKFVTAVENDIDKFDDMDEDAADDYYGEACDAVADEEVGMIYEAAIQIAISDNQLAYKEVAMLLDLADELGIDDVDAVLLIADTVKTEPELAVETDYEE